MQRFVFSFLALFFALTVLGVSVVQRIQLQVYAQAGISALPPSPSPKTFVDSLESPGLLPSHPLYPLKMVRDKVVLLMLPTPEARLQQRLMYADSRMAAGTALVQNGEFDTGVTTFFKGVHYLEQAVQELNELPEAAPDLQKRAGEASIVYEQLLIEAAKVLPEPAHPAVESLIGRVKFIEVQLGVGSH
jgi:hypothetical protein